jgi:hypothetical protein
MVQGKLDVSQQTAPPLVAEQLRPELRGQGYHRKVQRRKANVLCITDMHRPFFRYWLMLRAFAGFLQ